MPFTSPDSLAQVFGVEEEIVGAGLITKSGKPLLEVLSEVECYLLLPSTPVLPLWPTLSSH